MFDVIVIGAGPAGVVAALRAGDLGAKTALVTRDLFGGMAANDGPVPVRTLAHAARLMRDARQLGQYGIRVGEPVLDYALLLNRVREVSCEVRAHSAFRRNIDDAGVTVHEQCGAVRYRPIDACSTGYSRRVHSRNECCQRNHDGNSGAGGADWQLHRSRVCASRTD